jgi:hypothetical protein
LETTRNITGMWVRSNVKNYNTVLDRDLFIFWSVSFIFAFS